jgi:type I restriction enzyme R subunit
MGNCLNIYLKKGKKKMKNKIITQGNNSTVVEEYETEKNTSSTFQSESDLEKMFIDILKSQAYEYLNITRKEDLKNNIRIQLEKLNSYTFTDEE